MAVALILAAATQGNVVVGGVAVAQHICAHRRTALQTASVIMDGYYLDVFFKPLFIRGRFAERAHPSAAVSCFAFRRLHMFRLASCPVQLAFLCWTLSFSRCYNRAIAVTLKLHQMQ